MNILIVGPMLAILFILLSELFIELRQRYRDWRR
jgi:hypothetical protein